MHALQRCYGTSLAAYDFYPSPEQLRAWFDQAGLTIEEEGAGKWYARLLATKQA